MTKHKLFPTFGMLLSLTVAALLILACDTQKNAGSDHNAKTSLDYDGIYRGTLPCADCEGIKTTVYLNRNNTYKQVQQYLGKDGNSFETAGTFEWSKDGSTVILKDKKDKIQYFVGENTLTLLDQSGNKITGNLASHYILTKDNYKILHRKWRLTELMQKPVQYGANTPEMYIQFSDEDQTYVATAGCNILRGSFSTEAHNRLKLSQGISTMKACADMHMEDQLKQVLNTADSFIINGDELQLIRARMAPLAKFTAPVN